MNITTKTSTVLKCLALMSAIGGVVAAGLFWVEYECRHDIQCSGARDSWFNNRFDKNVSIFTTTMSKGYVANPEVASKLFAPHAETFAQFHGEHQRKGPIRCAVVGNGSNMVGAGYGNFIDQHDYVFRMNSAPIKGYEVDVGSKTTFNHVNGHPRIVIADYGPNSFAIVWVTGAQKIIDQLLPSSVFVQPDALKLASPATQRILVLDRGFYQYIKTKWFRVKNDEEPSTGLRMVVLALHLCDRVDLFGFGYDSDRRLGRYFKPQGVYGVGHGPAYQEMILNALHNRGFIRRYMGNASGDLRKWVRCANPRAAWGTTGDEAGAPDSGNTAPAPAAP